MSYNRKFVFVLLVLLSVCLVSLTGALNNSLPHRDSAEDTLTFEDETRSLDDFLTLTKRASNLTDQTQWNSTSKLHIQITAIHIDKSEFPLSELVFRLTLKLALEAVERRLESKRVKLLLNFRNANTCSRQYASAVAAEEYYRKKSRLFIVSGCDDAIRGVSRLASSWQVPVMTVAGFGADLNDKSVHKTLIRVAFSLRTAVEFLIKILKYFGWRRVNLIVDESDVNSLALKESIERHVKDYNLTDFRLNLNAIPLDLKSLMNQANSNLSSSTSTTDNWKRQANSSFEDNWPNDITEMAVRDALKQSSLFSRVNILLIPQNVLRRFMLSVYDQSMANGLYAFINMPLLLFANDDQVDNLPLSSNANFSKQSYTTSTGENVFVWRSLLSSRNSQAKQAFESLMSIYLQTPTGKAYVYFASKFSNLANSEFATTTTQTTLSRNSKESSGPTSGASKIQLNIDPYSASFYDCLQIYSILLSESLEILKKETTSAKEGGEILRVNLHARISSLVRKRRFDDMVTGSIVINENGDRDTDYTLDDLNPMTGKFKPVKLFKSTTKEIDHLARIHWSSDGAVGPTIDNVDCQLTGTCLSKPLSRFFVTLVLIAIPLSFILGFILYLVYKHINLESQLVDYWWRINYKDVEMIVTRRKAGEGSSVVSGSQTSSQNLSSPKVHQYLDSGVDRTDKIKELTELNGPSFNVVAKSSVTKVTDTSGAFASSAQEACYGNISLGVYKLNKVALKPIYKFHQSRKLMIELRTIKPISHNNLCRFVGIIVDEPNTALVSEFCPKGSLREFFQNESLVIDWTFKYSIINDIIAGLSYLHSSAIEYHGRLKSSNCLVSSRFVVKLSDYGLRSLHDQLDDHEEDEISQLKKLIWLAPEHLKASSKSRGSKKGDVYSFGLLLYEIVTTNLPFYNLEKDDYILPLTTLYETLKSEGPNETTGPDLSIIETSHDNSDSLIDLMKDCWRYDVGKRPSLQVVSSALKGITRGVTSKKLLENLTSRMEQYTNNLESLIDAKLATLLEEKQKTEELLYQFVPKSIAASLKEGQTVEPEAFECVTVFYSDIVGFTSLSSESSPMEVIDFLSELYLCFDETLEQYDIFKVDTIGDAYIVASGLPQPNEGKHATEIAHAAIELRESLAKFKIPHKPGRSLQMRVGIHSGPCIAGIVGGSNMPKYCVFGDTLATGKFMESSGLPMKIHITEESKSLLDAIGGFKIEARVPKISKDGIPLQTYWLENE